MKINPTEQRTILTEALVKDRKEVFVRFGENPSKSSKETLLKLFFFINGIFAIFVTLGIIYVLLYDGITFFQKVSLWEFYTGTEWSPFGQPKKLGVLPLINGTLMISLGSLLISIPIGITTAIYLTLYANKTVREILTPIIEVLGGIPTVVYGYFALTVVTPLLRYIFPNINIFNALSASIVVGISLIPIISSLTVESIRLVPMKIIMGGYAIGLTKFQVIIRIIIPAALSGIMASILLAFARAIGETMAVTLAAGSNPKMTLNYLESIQTMTAFIVQVSLGDTPTGSIEYYTIYAIGLTLFLVTFLFNYIAIRIVRKFREVYK